MICGKSVPASVPGAGSITNRAASGHGRDVLVLTRLGTGVTATYHMICGHKPAAPAPIVVSPSRQSGVPLSPGRHAGAWKSMPVTGMD